MAYTEETKNTSTFTLENQNRENSFLLKQDGDYLLLQNGDQLIIGSVGETSFTLETKN